MIRCYEQDTVDVEIDFDLEDHIDENLSEVISYINNKYPGHLDTDYSDLFPKRSNLDDLKLLELSILYNKLDLTELEKLTKNL